MSIVYYTKQDDYDFVNSDQDCMGWTVVDQTGNELGKVTDMLIDTDKDDIDSILIDDRRRVPAADISLGEGRVVVRGVMHGEQFAGTAQTTDTEEDYQPLPRGTGAKHVAGFTREANDDEVTLPVIEERLTVGKRTVESGGARVRTTLTERPVEERVNLREENVTVERHAVDRPVDAAKTIEAFKEGSFDVTTQAEVPIVSKESRVVEEVVINKDQTEHTETVRDTVKRSDVEVNDIDAGDANDRKNG